MDIIRLRTMTWKSKFTRGTYKGMTVEDVFDLGKGKLVWIYYSESTLTFIPEILDAIGIFERDRIEKPGKNVEQFRERRRRIALCKDGIVGIYKLNAAERAYRKSTARFRLALIEHDIYSTKANRQRINQHGHL